MRCHDVRRDVKTNCYHVVGAVTLLYRSELVSRQLVGQLMIEFAQLSWCDQASSVTSSLAKSNSIRHTRVDFCSI